MVWIHHFPMNSHNFRTFFSSVDSLISIQVVQVAKYNSNVLLCDVYFHSNSHSSSSLVLPFSSYICVAVEWIAVKTHSKQNLPNCWNRSINNAYTKYKGRNRYHHYNHSIAINRKTTETFNPMNNIFKSVIL